MTDLQRRAVLALGGTAALAPLAQARATPAAPRSPEDDWRPRWDRAPVWDLWPAGPPGRGEFTGVPQRADEPWHHLRNIAIPQLRAFVPRHRNGTAVLVMPGGGYEFVSVGNEGIDIADRLNARGFAVFVLTYRLPLEGWQEPSLVSLQDAQRALRVIRARAPQLALQPDRVAVMGFSAGGHLAAMLSTAHARPVYAPVDDADRESARPLAGALVYPVITMTQRVTHSPSRQRLLGVAPADTEVTAWSAEQQVDASTPPCFLAHACDDDAVPVDNSLWFTAAMRSAQRPVEAHLFQEGRHAFGVGRPGTPSASWIDLFVTWLQRT